MKSKQEYQAAIDEIAEVCKKHGIYMIGSCYHEGIAGEITLVDASDLDSLSWRDELSKIACSVYEIGDDFVVDGVIPK